MNKSKKVPPGSIVQYACIALSWCSGCQVLVNPFADETLRHGAVSTPSAAHARSLPNIATPRSRGFATKESHYPSGEVLHLPLYFEDPVEDKGSDDGQFAWTWEDFVLWPYFPGRFLLNSVAFPLSAVVTPPWTVMASDGRISRQLVFEDHDATRWSGSDPIQ